MTHARLTKLLALTLLALLIQERNERAAVMTWPGRKTR